MDDTQSSQQPPTEQHRNDTHQQPSLSSLSLLGNPSFDEQLSVHSHKSETLAFNDCDFDGRSFSELLEGVMAVNSRVSGNAPELKMGLVPPLDVGFREQFEISHQEVSASMTNKSAQAQSQMVQSGCSCPSTELSPVIPSESSVLNSILVTEEALSTPHDNICAPEVNQQTSSNYESVSASKTLTSDGYNWRKYGQKQVKNTGSSRSYYRCANSGCHAKKKVQRYNHSGCVIEILNEGLHNHDPPPKIRCTRSRRLVSSAGHVVGNDTIYYPLQKTDDSDQSMPRRDPRPASLLALGMEAHTHSSSDGDASIKVEEEDGDDLEPKQRRELQQPILLPSEQRKQNVSGYNEIANIDAQEKPSDEPMLKRRIKGSTIAYSGALLRTVKEPKIVVHTSGDAGVSSDGYRWRKYGQKMVKGNPHPRSYYRCTSAGCPVRKHVERALDDARAVIVTYEGKHDHDMPVPKKRHGRPISPLFITSATAVNNVQSEKVGTLSKQRSLSQCAEDMEVDLAGENVKELGGEKALESARTLLSMGIEIRPC
ncbi:probable WRKY transcription factor 32 isoform X2 [Cornus florida]|uniref:probable WRKY transcription factor 32 isoform X2 n=1 Tax=Cornus florida TaxID=4283 RepID=UPI00289C9CCA|nr:probable WRKY transcription factor 32 isoform X2 [Cornus florida]